MLDLNKPVQTRDGRKATILATNVLAHIKGTGIRNEGQTVLAQVEDEGGADYFSPDGLYHRRESCWDLVNVPEEPVVTEWFHTFKLGTPSGLDKGGIYLGCTSCTTAEDARHLTGGSWDGVLKLTTTDGKLTGIALV